MKKNLSILSVLILLVGCAIDNVGNNELLFTPKVVDDYFSIQKNSELTITLEDVLRNDKVQEKTTIVSFDTSTLQGVKLVKNQDGSYSYIPKKDFVGNDTFTYSVCNDKSKNYCSSANVVITVKDIDNGNPDNGNPDNSNTDNTGDTINISKFVIPSELKEYYSSLKFTKDATALKENLKEIISKYHFICYKRRHQYLLKADEDKENKNNIILIYNGKSVDKTDKDNLPQNDSNWFNTEHVVPQSFLEKTFNEKKSKKKLCNDKPLYRAIGDLHHLRYCNAKINGNRGNLPFAEGKGDCGRINKKWWYPGDEWKGDVARMVFYINLKYGVSLEMVGSKELFLKWNIEDPVSNFEKQRNNEIQKAQENRNPFIDNPYLATMIYGGKSAQNTWK